MNEGFRRALSGILAASLPEDFSTRALEFKAVFGAVAGYVNGAIFATCGRFGVALRLPPETLEELFKEDGVQPLRYFEKGHVKKEYAVLPERILEDRARFEKLVGASIEHVRTRVSGPR